MAEIQGGWALGGSSKRSVFPREYARSGHYGVFYLQNLKVSSLRFLKNSVGKVGHFVIGQKSIAFCLGNVIGCAIMGCFTYRI